MGSWQPVGSLNCNPPGGPWHKKAGKKPIWQCIYTHEQDFCSAILHHFFNSSPCTVFAHFTVNPMKAMTTVAHLGSCLQCRSSTKSTSVIIAWTEFIGSAHCNAPHLHLVVGCREAQEKVRSQGKPANNCGLYCINHWYILLDR